MASDRLILESTIGEHHLARLAEQSYERRGDYPSLLFEGEWLSSGEIFERSRRLGSGLTALGLRPGERVVVMMANCPEVAIVYQAVWRAGLVVTPATFLLPVSELRHVIGDAQAGAVVTTPELLPKVIDAIQGLPRAPTVICTEDSEPGVIGLRSLLESDPTAIVARGDDDLAALLYTGGTTGAAKGVMLSHANLHFSGRAAHAAAYVPGLNRALVTLPLSHAYGMLVTIAAMHSPERGISVLLRWFDPAAFLSLIAEHRLQLTAVVPSMLQILLSHPLHEHDLSSLRYVTSGGSPLAPDVQREFERRVPGVSIRQGYGLTECAALISTNPTGRERSGSVGLPVAGTELEIRDRGRPMPVGEIGEVCARSPGVMLGYWGAPELTAQTIRDGWLHTGDLGYRDEDGYLFLVDRIKDLIIRGGFNVYPRDVEDALMEHPAVQMAGVIGRPSTVHGEEVVAFVARHPGAEIDAEQLIGWARERIGGYKYPREIRFVDAVPLTPVGKIDRKALRRRVDA